MPRARVTYKGQVTIPKRIREQLGIAEGDEVLFVALGTHAVLERIPRPSVAELRGALPATRPYPGKEAVRDEAELAAVQEVLGPSPSEP